ncbi:MAG TPA: glycosyltransferase family 8 protein [Afipia sp.]
MHIVSASDDGFIPHFAAMLHSAWLYHPAARFYLLDAGLKPESLDKLEGFAREHGIDLTIIPCADRLGRQLPSIYHRAAYARWLIPELLAGIGQALYVDADVSVTGSLCELFSVDLEGHPIAAMCDGVACTSQMESLNHGVSLGADYFNTGLMVMNLQQWRDEEIASRAFAYAAANRDILPYHDQSVLNVVLRGRNKPIDRIWNFFDPYEIELLNCAPRVIHYVSALRPTRWPDSPYADLYKFHRDQTPWPFTKLPSRRLKYMKRRIGAAAGIARYKRNLEEYRLLDVVRTTVAEPALKRAQALVESAKRRIPDMRPALNRIDPVS